MVFSVDSLIYNIAVLCCSSNDSIELVFHQFESGSRILNNMIDITKDINIQ